MRKNKSLVLGTILLAVIIFISAVSSVQATVGGETLIYDFKYNSADESIYYTMQSGGGRGCPPMLKKLSLNSEKVDTVLTCEQAEELSSPANEEIDKITKSFKPLTPLNLKTNNISIDVNFVRSENYSPAFSEIVKRYFTATVYQSNKKVGELTVIGCNLDQPFTFQGYAIPGYDKRIALLSSTKGDCFEGGYTAETLYTVSGVDNLNKIVSTNFYKGASALIPNEGNLVVYESDKVEASSISISQFIELLIQIGVISPAKASAARAIFGI